MLFTRHGAHVPQVTEEGLPTALKPRIAIFRDLGDMAGLLNASGEQIVAGLSSGQGGALQFVIVSFSESSYDSAHAHLRETSLFYGFTSFWGAVER